MVKNGLLRTAAVVLTSVGLIAGLGGGIAGASAGTVSNTGPDSSNKVLSILKNRLHVENTNHVVLGNENEQGASSGSANVSDNTTGGSAKSGAATTANATHATLNLTNSMPTMTAGSTTSNTGTIHETGPDSSNEVVSIVKNHVTVENDNTVCLTNSNEQTASTGDANVSGNTTGGSATTGNASTVNSSSFSVSIKN